jgi:GTP 3',8-cyclase
LPLVGSHRQERGLVSNVDKHDRTISYLRVSITDRCNMRCIYCMPESGLSPLSLLKHEDVLSFEEIVRVVRIAAGIGITKVRLTGGEPLVRRNVLRLVSEISNIPGIQDVGLTTNGVALKDMARPLWQAGLRRINVSLDTLNSLKFQRITRTPYYKQVRDGIAEAEATGFRPLKINAVVIKGINDDDIVRFGRLSMEKPYAIRFIEYIPMSNEQPWDPSMFLSGADIISRLEVLGTLIPVERTPHDGPSLRYRFRSAKGEIGLISAMSHSFCPSCNRLRLTSDGQLRPCLLSDRQVDVREGLRSGCSDEQIRSLILNAIANKPRAYSADLHQEQPHARYMWRIGG